MFKEIRQNGKSIVKVMKNGSIIWQKPNPGILPAGYIECEYLESAAGSDATLTYINTGISFVYGDYIHIKSQLIGTIVDDAFAVSHYPWSGARMAVGGSCHNKFTFGVANTETSTLINLSVDNNAHDFELKLKNDDMTQYRYNAYVDNVYYRAYVWPASNYAISTNQLRLFTGYAYQQCRIYMFEMKDNLGNHKINLIPCLDTLGVPCMYDTVSKTTFYNQGTGTFGYKIKDPELEYAGYGTLYKLPLGNTYIKDFGWMRGYYHDLHANVCGSGASDAFACLSNPILIEPGYTYTVVRPSSSGAGNNYNAWFPVPAPGRPGETGKNYKLLCGGDPMSQEMSQPSDARYLYVSFKAYNTANFDRNYNGIYITKSRTV